MRAWTRAVPAAVLAVTATLAYGAAPAHSQPVRYGRSSPTIAWTPCPEDANVQCGTISVPADWADPYGPTITLTVARRPAADPTQRIGVLLVNPGGPGGSAVDFALDAPTYFSQQLRKRFDIVGMDPRGVGRSAPVTCAQALVDAVGSPLIETEQAYADTVAANRRLAADCAQRSPGVFAHVDAVSVARDMDAVRVALGEDRISVYGASYGSVLGEEYEQRFSVHLRAVVLDAVMDHSVRVDDFLRQASEAAQDSFDEFVAWCARDPRCVVHGQDVGGLWTVLLARARAGTLVDPYDPLHRLGLFDLLQAAFTAFYDPQWYSFAYFLRDATAQPAGATVQLTSRSARLPGAEPGETVAHSFPAVFCADWQFPITGFSNYQARLRELAVRAPRMLVSPLAISATASCLGWPRPPADPQHDLRAAEVPVLLVNAVHDPATAYRWAQQVAQQLGPKATLLTYQGWGHVVYEKSTCAADFVDRFLIDLTSPAAGSTCPAVEPEPFGIG